MSSAFTSTFDAVEFLRSSCLTGAGFGKDAAAELKRRIAVEGEDRVWIIDLTRSIAIDYRFISNFLGSILDPVATADNTNSQPSNSSLPNNTILIVRCRFATVRKNVIDGLSWRKGDRELAAETDALKRIRDKRRFCTLVDISDAMGLPAPYFLGTTEPELIKLLKLVERLGEIQADQLPKHLGQNTQDTTHAIDELQSRRLLYRRPDRSGEKSAEPTFISIGKILEKVEP